MLDVVDELIVVERLFVRSLILREGEPAAGAASQRLARAD